VKLKFCNPQKALPCTKPRHMSHHALKSARSFFFPVEDGKKKKEREGKERKSTKSHPSVIFHLFVRKAPWTDFHQIMHIRRYAKRNHLCKFWFKKLRDLGHMGGRILGFPIEMAGHPYNSAALPRSLWLYSVHEQTYRHCWDCESTNLSFGLSSL